MLADDEDDDDEDVAGNRKMFCCLLSLKVIGWIAEDDAGSLERKLSCILRRFQANVSCRSEDGHVLAPSAASNLVSPFVYVVREGLIIKRSFAALEAAEAEVTKSSGLRLISMRPLRPARIQGDEAARQPAQVGVPNGR